MIYFDYAAATPMDKDALHVFMEASKDFYGNTSSLHNLGGMSSNLLSACRKEISMLLNVSELSVIFTSGGTESNILAIQTLLSALCRKKTILSSRTEHSSISNYLTMLEKERRKVVYLQHTSDGQIDLQHFEYLIKTEDISLITVQHVNPEIGCIQPIEQIRSILGERKTWLHVDAVQSFGKLDMEAVMRSADSISISSHKIYGPKGTGALIFPRTLPTPFYEHVSHEAGYRPGTVNVPAIAAFITAAKKAFENRENELMNLKKQRKDFIQFLKQEDIPHTIFKSCQQAPYIIGLSFPGIQGQYMMLELNRRGFAVSTGSACQIGKQAPSKTMIAMGKSPDQAKELLRISLGKHVKKEDIRALSQAAADIVRQSGIIINI
ncbi:cysteine desulfurase [Peribacillus deserti]|uniref:Cysteine desulfurase n=1 Tax=Peribacillus deserti TaxID=673318 RepID=A0ABS2QFH7_9BACI|nr:IscS subfamily cysteine desulfurase [Peribacillus deserti]MBM7691906.1 cysteine desulfurase [Peribacillus deserti]